MAPLIEISPPLVNSSNPWATTVQDLQGLYDLPWTGAVTTRTCLLEIGFPDDPSIHQHGFFNGSSINSYGYSPHPLKYYLDSIWNIVTTSGRPQKKPFIISVTGDQDEVTKCFTAISSFSARTLIKVLCEINLSCPNIPSKPPPAYDSAAIVSYLAPLHAVQAAGMTTVPVGIKTPPYTYHAQFAGLIAAVETCPSVLSFITATNTLGSSLFYCAGARGQLQSIINSSNGSGMGGLAGESIHALSLGNVFAIRNMLDESKIEGMKDIVVIGVGGVCDNNGYMRMKEAGASVVGIGTAFGLKGLVVFQDINNLQKHE